MYHVHTYNFCRLWKRSNKNNHSGLCKTIDLLLIVCHRLVVVLIIYLIMKEENFPKQHVLW